MKIYIFFAILSTFGLHHITLAGFVDIRPNQEVYDSVQYFVEKNIINDQGRFSPDSIVTHNFFWMLLISEAGFSNGITSGDLPSNINPDSIIAPFLRQASRLGLLNTNKEYLENTPVTELEALKIILASKNIDIPNRPSVRFRKKVGKISPRSGAIRYMEAGHASHILSALDVSTFAPHRNLSRKKFVTWLHNYVVGGEKQESTIETSRYSSNNPNRRSFADLQKREQTKVPKALKNASQTLTIPDGKILEAVLAQIESSFRFDDQLTVEKKRDMINAGIRAMVEAMDDKYSSYIQPKDVSKFKDSLDGKFSGVGAFVDMIDGKFTIESPIKGSPAEDAGLEPGDIVIEVDGENIESEDTHTIVNMIKGEAGTDVTLNILREGRRIDFTITRGEITVPALDLKWEKAIPIIGIHQFSRNTGTQLKQMIANDILPKNPRGIIIDVRSNPGGYLTTAVQVSSLFFEEGRELFHVEYRKQKETYKAPNDGILKGFDNIVLLQNKGSASASEILAAVLKDYNRATIIGTPSLGKGTVQDVTNFNNGGVLKLTVAKWLSPKGNWVHETGVIPDIEMEAQTVEQRRADIDPPLDRAINAVLGR